MEKKNKDVLVQIQSPTFKTKVKNMERLYAYARNDEIADKIREKIKTFPDNMMEELKTEDGSIKFEFSGSMIDSIELMGLGASIAGRL